jgi:hypothetical protein
LEIERLIPNTWGHVVHLIEQDPDRAILFAVSVFILGVSLYLLYSVEIRMGRLRNGRKFWRGKMSGEQRARELVAERFTSALEDMWLNNEITLRQRNRMYAQLRRILNVRGLKPRKRIRKDTAIAVFLKDKAARGLEALKAMRPLPLPEPPAAKKTHAIVVVRKKKA